MNYTYMPTYARTIRTAKVEIKMQNAKCRMQNSSKFFDFQQKRLSEPFALTTLYKVLMPLPNKHLAIRWHH